MKFGRFLHGKIDEKAEISENFKSSQANHANMAIA